MATVNVCVIRTAGTNCDEETRYAFEMVGARADLIHVNNLIAKEHTLADYQILAIPGGFTYGDDVASGKVFAVELSSMLGDMISAFVAKGGLVIGICNGFQVQVKMGLLPDAKIATAAERNLTLTHNDSNKFEARWVWLEADKNAKCLFVEGGERIYVPVAHGEGKLVARRPDVIQAMEKAGQIAYRYVNEDGSAPVYPADPNGSIGHIAGVCDPSGRIFGLMPHPERHLFPYQNPQWTRRGLAKEGDGVRVFRRAIAACR